MCQLEFLKNLTFVLPRTHIHENLLCILQVILLEIVYCRQPVVNLLIGTRTRDAMVAHESLRKTFLNQEGVSTEVMDVIHGIRL